MKMEIENGNQIWKLNEIENGNENGNGN